MIPRPDTSMDGIFSLFMTNQDVIERYKFTKRELKARRKEVEALEKSNAKAREAILAMLDNQSSSDDDSSEKKFDTPYKNAKKWGPCIPDEKPKRTNLMIITIFWILI